MKPIELFDADDFKNIVNTGNAVMVANAKLKDWLKSAVRVYSQSPELSWTTHNNDYAVDTHTALLVCIEEIEKKPCEHIPRVEFGLSTSTFYCSKCGIRLKSTGWKAVSDDR